MTTTFHLDPTLFLQVQQRAQESGQTVDQFVEAALKAAVGSTALTSPQHVVLRSFPGKGKPRPGINLDDGAALRDLLDEADGPLGR